MADLSSIKKQLLTICNPGDRLEKCGYVLADNTVVEVKNVHPSPQESFAISDEHVSRIMFENLPVWHSHTANSGASDNWSGHDIRQAVKQEYVLILYHAPTGRIREFDPAFVPPYEGREWNVYTSSCEVLLRDFYLQEFGIKLMRWIPDSPQPWIKEGWDEYRIELEKHGFKNIGRPGMVELRRGDVALMKVGRAAAPNHAAIVTDPSKNIILHHLVDRLSLSESYGQGWRNATHGIYRHPRAK